MAFNPSKKGESDNSPESVGMKGRCPGLPSGGSPKKSGKDVSPEELTGSRPLSDTKSAPSSKKSPLD